MQSRLSEATRRASCALSSTTRLSLKREFCSGTRSRTADPEIHSGEQEAGPRVHRGQPQVSVDLHHHSIYRLLNLHIYIYMLTLGL